MKRWQLRCGACPLAVMLVLMMVLMTGCGGGQETIPVEESAVPEGSVGDVGTDVTDAGPLDLEDDAEETELPKEVETREADESAEEAALPELAGLGEMIEADPATAHLGRTVDEIESAFGAPSMEGDWRGAYFLSYDQENYLFWFDYPAIEKVIGVGFLNYQEPGQHHYLDLERGITFDEIREKLGAPDSEGVDETDEIGGYLYNYVTDQHSVTIGSVDNTPGVVGYVEVLLRYEWR